MKAADPIPLAHISEDETRSQTLTDHLRGTAALAGQFASAFSAGAEGEFVGLLHDLGKDSPGFQHRLHGGPPVDHSTAGAQAALQQNDPCAAFAIAGHHSGIPDGGHRQDAPDEPTLFGRIKRQVPVAGGLPPITARPALPAWVAESKDNLTTAFFTRMLFSCLVDADFLDTETFMNGSPAPRGMGQSIPELLKKMKVKADSYLTGAASSPVGAQRNQVLQACLEQGRTGPRGIYTLTVPTGGGKTFASLAFALEHAAAHGLNRVIYVIPYTSIIDQTAQTFTDLLGEENVLAHFSTADYKIVEKDDLTPSQYRSLLASENWDAPVIVTTAVQFFESLYANRSSRCRKLHNLANSVLIFDEAQTLPCDYLRPCVSAIAQLVQHYGVTAVLCTATQPDLGGLFREFAPEQPLRELSPDPDLLYQVLRRVTLGDLGTVSYFMVSAGAQLILQELEERGHALEELDKYAVVHINDTHPSMVIPELIRLLTERGVELERAMDLVERTCAYTNHTILAEALEKWPASYLEQVSPQLLPFIRALDERARKRSDAPELAIWDAHDVIHMAHMDIHSSAKVNGVAELHTEILKNTELHSFYVLYPEKFNNKTNGITFRRWLMGCNPALSDLITQAIGPEWKRDAGKLEGLMDHMEDSAFREQLLSVKGENKTKLARWLKGRGTEINPDSILDIQIKRLHQYKRQQMNALYAIWKYLQIKEGRTPTRPVTMVFGGKAAPAYTLAKDTIHLLLCLSRLIDQDPQVSPWLKLVMVENYNVSSAELLVPACDVSEQISLASKEASGTGNMKLMANGAVTLGTLDGANVEISRLVGEENIYIFGRSADEVIDLYQNSAYRSSDYWQKPEVERLVDFIISPQLLTMGDAQSLSRLYKDFISKDYFMALLDLEDYIAVKERCLTDYEDRDAWSRRMLVNIARSGFFSSDRTIAEYDQDIWHLK